MDLTKIPEFHPRVVKVDLLSGKGHREPGASYQCHLSGGKHACVEKDIEIIPLQKIVTILPEDTFGISKILSDYRVETKFQSLGHRSTKVEISHYYSTTTLKAKLLNLVAKGKIARDTQAILKAAKATIEKPPAGRDNRPISHMNNPTRSPGIAALSLFFVFGTIMSAPRGHDAALSWQPFGAALAAESSRSRRLCRAGVVGRAPYGPGLCRVRHGGCRSATRQALGILDGAQPSSASTSQVI